MSDRKYIPHPQVHSLEPGHLGMSALIGTLHAWLPVDLRPLPATRYK